MKYFINCFKQYAITDGRARRREFWILAIVMTVLLAITHFIDGKTGYTIGNSGAGYLSLAVFAVFFLPALSVTIRRLHDIGRSGWWLLAGVIPIIGWLILFIFICLDGQYGENRFGEDPKSRAADNQLKVV